MQRAKQTAAPLSVFSKTNSLNTQTRRGEGKKKKEKERKSPQFGPDAGSDPPVIPETRTDQSGLSEAADDPQRSSKGGGGVGWGTAQQGLKWRLIVSTFKGNDDYE